MYNNRKKHPVYLRTAKKRCPRWRSCSAPRSVPESSTPKQRLIKWGFTEYVISFSTCRFKAVCIRNKTSFLFQQTLEIANVPELTTKGDNFFLRAAEWTQFAGTWPKINHSSSNKTTFCVYITWFLHFIAVFLSLQFFIFFNLDISDKRFSKKTWLVRKSLMILDGHPILVVSWISLDAFSRC